MQVFINNTFDMRGGRQGRREEGREEGEEKKKIIKKRITEQEKDISQNKR